MGLRDLFDADKRSKEDLRQQLKTAEQRYASAIALYRDTVAKGDAALSEVARGKAAIQAEQARLADSWSGIAAERERLDTQRTALKAERKRLDEEQGRLEDLARSLRGKQGNLALQFKKVEKLKATLEEWHQALDQRDLALQTDTQTCQEQAAELAKRSTAMASREAAVRGAEDRVAQIERALQPRLADLKRTETRIDEKLETIERAGKLEEREAAVSQRENAVRRREDGRQVVDDALTAARQQLASLENDHRQLQQRLYESERQSRANRERAEAESLKANQAEETRRALVSQVKDLRGLLEREFLLRVSSEPVLNWLACLNAEAVIGEVGHEPITIGSGPWDEELFDTVLEQAGFVPQLLDEHASEFEVFVVGESGVEIDALAGAIQARLDEGLPVKLYSQELWLLYLMSGTDPLQQGADALRSVFGEGHGSLAAFIDDAWGWPELRASEAGGGTGEGQLERGSSPLHAFGYRAGVGVSSPVK